MSSLTKDARLETRLTKNLKKMIEEAATIKGLTLSDFVIQSLQNAAEDTIETAKQNKQSFSYMKLSKKDQELFVNSLLNPPKANSALRKALKKEKTMISEN